VKISIAVDTKESLLGGELPFPIIDEHGTEIRGERSEAEGFEAEWRTLNELTWDQQGLVDYEALLRSSSLGGTWETSFSWNVAMRRHVVAGGGTWISPSSHASRVSKRSNSAKRAVNDSGFEDTASIIFGPHGDSTVKMFELSMWS